MGDLFLPLVLSIFVENLGCQRKVYQSEPFGLLIEAYILELQVPVSVPKFVQYLQLRHYLHAKIKDLLVTQLFVILGIVEALRYLEHFEHIFSYVGHHYLADALRNLSGKDFWEATIVI